MDVAINFECTIVPPWTLKPSTFIFDVHKIGNKLDVPPEVFRSKVNELLVAYASYERIYTDGSKAGTAVAAAALSGPRLSVKRLPNGSSIFSALNIADMSVNERILILSHCLSCLQSIDNQKLNHPLILEIVTVVHRLTLNGKQLVFMWQPIFEMQDCGVIKVTSPLFFTTV